MSTFKSAEPEPGPDNSRSDSTNTEDENLEWCFPVRCDRGLGEVRVRANGNVVWTGGSDRGDWVCLDGIAFPTERTTRVEVFRHDILRIDTLDSLEGTDLGGERYLFHFTKACAAIKILSSGSLRFSSFEALNDPWEAKNWAFVVVSPEGSIAPMGAVEIGREMSALLRESSRVLCFCSDGQPLRTENNLEVFDAKGWDGAGMWAHYGDQHCGVALMFNRRRLLENGLALKSRAQAFFGSVLYAPPDHHVGYNALLIDHREWMSKGNHSTAARHLESHRGWLFFTKHPDWSAERECRLVLHGCQPDHEYLPVGDSLVEICLGDAVDHRTSEEMVAFAKQFSANVTRIVWRNGIPQRTPIFSCGNTA